MFAFDKLPNISDYRDISNIPYLFLGILIVDLAVIFLARYLPIKNLNVWYDDFEFHAVFADVLSILLGFILCQFIYTKLIMPYFGWNPIIFILILVLIQISHDLFFYYFIVLPMPQGHNGIIDIFKKYVEGNIEIRDYIIVSDSLMMISSVLIVLGLKYLPNYAITFMTTLTMYTMIYILNTKNEVKGLLYTLEDLK
jgi:hypothetical protein